MTISSSPSRREFIIRLGSVATLAAAGSVLSGCGGGDSFPEFNFGVASGDPLSDRVILWTHAKFLGAEDDVDLTYEVATDSSFSSVVSSGPARASRATGFTAKVDATGLSAGQGYFYRFRYRSHNSPVGRTRTLPPTGATQLKLAVMSCSNYPAGFFNVYAEVAKSDCEYALHLGDYIYEYDASPTAYASASAAALGRVSVPAVELTTLDHYRLRHAQYKSDVDSKVLHARMPMISVWDDHEIANDAYRDGAQNHQANEGSWEVRKAAAVQAYHEWMPIRTTPDRSKIYRSLNFGNLVQLHMLDTRLVGRDEQVSLVALAQGNPSALASFASPSRQLLGAEQVSWLTGQLAASAATWQVLGQQVIMARVEFPASVLSVLNPDTLTNPAAVQSGLAAVQAYLTAKLTPAANRTQEQTALMNETVNPRLGYNLDAWDGYLAARETVLATAAQLGKRLVVLAGDTHNAWHNNLTLKGLVNPALANTKVGEEFATPSVSSPGLEEYFRTIPAAQIEQIFTSVPDDVRWLDASRRGFLKMTFTPTEVTGEWFFVSSISSRDYSASLGRTAVYSNTAP